MVWVGNLKFLTIWPHVAEDEIKAVGGLATPLSHLHQAFWIDS